MKWEQVASPSVTLGTGLLKVNSSVTIARAKVPGGCLVVYYGLNIIFYPDPTHSWDPNDPSDPK